jgi:hypothetical protein
MSNFKGKVKGVKLNSSDSSNYSVIVEVEDNAHQVSKVSVTFDTLTTDPSVIDCSHLNVGHQVCIYIGKTEISDISSGGLGVKVNLSGNGWSTEIPVTATVE